MGVLTEGACLLPRTVDPVRIPPVAAEQPPGRQQRHHQHLRVTERLISQSYQPGHILTRTRGYAVRKGSEMPENADSFQLQHKEKAATKSHMPIAAFLYFGI